MAKSQLCQAMKNRGKCYGGYLEMSYLTEANIIWEIFKSKKV